MKHTSAINLSKYLKYVLVGSIVLSSILASYVALAASADVRGQVQVQPGMGRPPEMGSGRGEMMGNRGSGIFGTVSEIDGSTLTVVSVEFGPDKTEKTYTVDASEATVMKDQDTSTLGSIDVGDTVMVQGTVDGTSVTATLIRDGVLRQQNGDMEPIIEGDGNPVIGGTVTAKEGSILTVTNKSGVTYTVDVSDATIQKGGAEGSVSDIEVNDAVVIQGEVNGNDVIASSVIDSGALTSDNNKDEKVERRGFGGFIGGIISGVGGMFHNLFGFF
jgi:hypothetical protein